MAHFSHPRELEPAVLAEAVRRIRSTGAVIRTQAPLIRSINDDPETWRAMWRTQVRLGMIPYYMFVERDTGPQDYFAVPLARGYEIFRDAYQGVSGLARTVRGPSMSATPGKVCVDGVTEVAGLRVFVLRMIQARDPRLVGTPFFARFDPAATWLTDLEPVFADRFPFEPSPYETVPDALPGLWPDEPGELMVPGHLTRFGVLDRRLVLAGGLVPDRQAADRGQDHHGDGQDHGPAHGVHVTRAEHLGAEPVQLGREPGGRPRPGRPSPPGRRRSGRWTRPAGSR